MASLDVNKALRNFGNIRSEIDDMLKLGYEEGNRRKSDLEAKIRTNLRLSFDDGEDRWADFNDNVYPRFFPAIGNGNDPQGRYLTIIESAKRKVDSYIQELELLKSFTAEESDDIITMRRHVAEGESVSVEFKENFPSNAKELSNNIASFCSSNQGFIYLGIDKKGKILGLPDMDTPSQKDALQLRIVGLTKKIDPPVQVKVDFLRIDSKNIVRVITPKGVDPIYYSNNVPYIRDLSSSRPASPQEVKEYHRLYFETNKVPAAETKNQESLRSLASTLSDAELALSDTEDHYPGITMQQLQYDLGIIVNGITNFLTSKIVNDLAVADDLRGLRNKLVDMNHYKFYPGEVYYQDFTNIAKEGMQLLENIKPLFLKNIVMTPTSQEEFLDILKGILNKIKEQWEISKKFRVEESDVESTRDYFRIIGYEIHRLAYLPESQSIRDRLIIISRKFRKLSTLEGFGPSLNGFDSIQHVSTEVEECIVELEKGIGELSSKSN